MRIGHVAFTVAVVLLALAVPGCSRKRYKIPSGAMLPTLGVGDHVTADTSVTVPTRGDIFVFLYPEHPEQSFVKRVVGLPGDRIQVAGQTLSVNGRALPTCVVGHHSYAEDDGSPHDGELVLENGGAATYLVFYDRNGGTDGSWTVGPGEYFVVGDNRNNSHDSRLWFGGRGGGVPSKLLQGRVAAPTLSLPKGASALEASFAKCKKDLGVAP